MRIPRALRSLLSNLTLGFAFVAVTQCRDQWPWLASQRRGSIGSVTTSRGPLPSCRKNIPSQMPTSARGATKYVQ